MQDSPIHRLRILDEEMPEHTPSSDSLGGRRLDSTFFRGSDQNLDNTTPRGSAIFSALSPSSQHQHTPHYSSSSSCSSSSCSSSSCADAASSAESLDSVFRHSLGSLFGQDELRSPTSESQDKLSSRGALMLSNINTGDASNHHGHTHSSSGLASFLPTTPGTSDFDPSKDIFNFISENDAVRMMFPSSPLKEPLSPVASPTGLHLSGPG